MELCEVTFEDVLPIWRDKLWPDRTSPIEPASSMLYLGGYNIDIKKNPVRFFAVRDGTETVGVISGHQTDGMFYRIRGTYVEPDAKLRGVGRMLVAAVDMAGQDAGCGLVWGAPRQVSLPFYLKCGFIQTSDFFDEGMEFGPNCYMLKGI